MKIHIVTNRLDINSGFSIVGKNIALGLKELGHDVTVSGQQQSYCIEDYYGIASYPVLDTQKGDVGQLMSNILDTDPDVILNIFQSDIGDFGEQAFIFDTINKLMESVGNKKKIKSIWYCLLPDSPIFTLDRGVQKIKDIKIGDKVLTHKGRFKNVCKTMNRPYDGDIIKITPLKLHNPILLTPEHKILSIKTKPCIGQTGIDKCRYGSKCYDENGRKKCKYIHGEEPWRKYRTEWIESKNLQVGDLVIYPKSSEKEIDIDKIRIIDYIDDFLNVSGDNCDDNSQQTDIFGEYIERKIAMNSYYSKKHGKIPAEFELNKDIMRLFGYFIAEGGIYPNSIYFAFNKEECDYINDLKQIMKITFGLDPTESLDSIGNGITLIYSNTILSNLFENLFAPKIYQTKKGRGKKSNIVRIPSEFLNLPLEKLKEMIKGIWRGDGSYYKNRFSSNKKNCEYSISTTSQTLAYQLVHILSKYNILCSISLKPPRKEHHAMSYDVVISGQDIELFENIINETNLCRDVYRQANKYMKGKKYFFMPITHIDIIRYKGDVWNIDVEEDNSYVSTIAVHNCPVETRWLPNIGKRDLKSFIQLGGKVVSQCKWGQTEMKKEEIDNIYIYHGIDNKIFRPLNENQIKEIGQQLKESGGREKPNIILNFTNDRWIEEDVSIEELYNRYRNKFVFLVVANNFGVRKRIERAMKAYSIFVSSSRQIRDRCHLHLHTYPNAIGGVNLDTYIKRYGIEKDVTFSYGKWRSGWGDIAMGALYNSCDCHLSASSGEGYGISSNEAMATGLPTVGPRCSSFGELIEEEVIGENGKKIGPRGLLVEGEYQALVDCTERFLVNENQLANTMMTMYKEGIKDSDKYNEYKNNCIEFAKLITWEKIVKQWESFIREMK